MKSLKDLKRYTVPAFTTMATEVLQNVYLCSDVEARLEQHNDTLSDLYNEIDKRDQKITALPKWVSVDKQLPEKGGWYPVIWEGTRGDWMYWNFNEPFPSYISHWLNKTPPAPEMEDETT